MSFWDFSLENTGRTQIVSIQYQEQYGRAKKPVFMRVFAVSSVIPTRCRDSHLKQFCLEYIVPAILIILITHIIVAIRWMLIKILSAVIKHRGEYTVIVVDWFRCIIA